jgi:hypothetical protein
MHEMHRKKHHNLMFEEFYEPKDKKPSTVAEADYMHKKLMENYNNLRYRDKMEPGYLEYENVIYQNYYNYMLSYIKSHSGHDYPKDGKTLIRHTEAINRCFFSNTLEEITENLKRENTPFSQMVLD